MICIIWSNLCDVTNCFAACIWSFPENVLNRDEFDGDADAGVYNPVVLPWKNRSEKLQ